MRQSIVVSECGTHLPGENQQRAREIVRDSWYGILPFCDIELITNDKLHFPKIYIERKVAICRLHSSSSSCCSRFSDTTTATMCDQVGKQSIHGLTDKLQELLIISLINSIVSHYGTLCYKKKVCYLFLLFHLELHMTQSVVINE